MLASIEELIKKCVSERNTFFLKALLELFVKSSDYTFALYIEVYDHDSSYLLEVLSSFSYTINNKTLGWDAYDLPIPREEAYDEAYAITAKNVMYDDIYGIPNQETMDDNDAFVSRTVMLLTLFVEIYKINV